MNSGPHTRRALSPASLVRHYEGFLRSLRHKQPETRGTYDRALREFLRWYPRSGITHLETKDVERYKRHLTGRKKLSAVSVSTYLTALRRFCEYLVRHNILRENPARTVGGNNRPRLHSRDALSAAEILLLLESVDRSDERGLRDYAFILLMSRCALSEIEIIRADVGDRIVREGQEFLRVQGKGRVEKDQAVALPEEAISALNAYLATRDGGKAGDPMFTSAGNRTRGERMTTRGVRDRVNLYLEQAGLKGEANRHVTPYSLRHAAAALMVQSGASAEEIQQRMRLGSVATAMLYIKQGKAQSTAS